MQRSNIKAIYIKNMLLLLFFGILVSFISTYIYYTMQHKQTDKKVADASLALSNKIKSYTKGYLDRIDNSIDAIHANKLFKNYLLNPSQSAQDDAISLFINTMQNNQNFIQLRFIDNHGMEKIRVDRQNTKHKVIVVPENKLQNKSDRYYFKETIIKKINKFWHSALDLNIENGKIEKPIRPTLRVATNVYYQGKHYGILIVNIGMSSFLTSVKNNNLFDTYLIDKDGYFILHPNKEKIWGKYLHHKHTIYTDFPDAINELKKSNKFAKYGVLYSLEEYFKNGENIKLGLNVKDTFIHELKSENMEFAFSMGVIILLISIPLGIFISIPISKLYLKFNKLYKDNKRHLETIDKYVFTMTVDLDKKITYVSSALCENSGYTKEELIGKTPSVFNTTRLEPSVYNDLWNSVSSGSVWHGELQNKKKNGESYWIDITILPNYNEANQIESYTSISKDISEKKHIEKISEIDKLTQLFNRVKLDDCLVNEFNRFSRGKHIFSIMMLDIDYFKSVNDEYGHQVGDSVLVEFSNLLKKHSRKTDIVGRWGGEEFMIICIDTHIQGATNLAESLRVIIEKFEFNIVKHKTVSIGVAQVKETDTINSLIKRADDYLYQAKANGRNNVVSDL